MSSALRRGVSLICAVSVAAALAGCGAAPSTPKAAVSPTSGPCRLPVGGSAPGIGGFFSYPSGTYVPDQLSDRTYNTRFGKWLSAFPLQLSPDGAAYLAIDDMQNKGVVNAVDISSGRVREISTLGSPGHYPELLGWTADGIDYVIRSGREHLELHVMDPSTGRTRLIVDGESNSTGLSLFHSWTFARDGVVWTTANDGGPGMGSVVRVDVATGHAQLWYGTDASVNIITFTAGGNPIALLRRAGGMELAVLTGANGATHIGAGELEGVDVGITDAHGAWMIGHDGMVWLYDGVRLRNVGKVPVPPQPTRGVAAGFGNDSGPFPPYVFAGGPCV